MTDDETKPPRQRKERKDNADKRRRQVLEATLRSVVENGLAKTTLATVASEAGLSQGVAVFYFQSKDKLLAAALEHHYVKYEAAWRKALERAGEDPAERIAALIRADFAPEVCNRDALAVWFSFWGEASFHPRFADSAREFDTRRSVELTRLCRELSADAAEDAARDTAHCIDSLTDGFWQRLYLTPESFTVAEAFRLTMAHLRMTFPDRAGVFTE